MTVSVFDIFTIGIGPSSSHTIGPMRAVRGFLDHLKSQNLLSRVHRVQAEFFGSLGLTGRAHGTDKAVLLGFEGEVSDTINPDLVDGKLKAIRDQGKLHLDQSILIDFDEAKHFVFHRNQSLPLHPNGMAFSVYASDGQCLLKKIYYSIGGGFVIEDAAAVSTPVMEHPTNVPYPFQSAKQLLDMARSQKFRIAELILANELVQHTRDEIRNYLLNVWSVMQQCVQRGLKTSGILPGGLAVERRAPKIFAALSQQNLSDQDPLAILDWVNLYALSVNEENAAGGRVVTAPTNGAAGIVPAVMHYYRDLKGGITDEEVVNFLLVAGAIATLFKLNASISGAEVGCQGEVGVACSMAAGGLTALLGGSNEQIENAAEIGMEHNLGLTCDPVGGLVQIPCIERNAMGAIKAINASRLALRGDGSHKISLDRVIRTMRETGRDMMSKYKETSQGGLAVNYIDC